MKSYHDRHSGTIFSPGSNRSIKPWLIDIATALILIALCVMAFAAMGYVADLMRGVDWLS